eukprot:TRINITY_DN37291_c0_g1_i1.p1 TRINITY_DN37291_c0_g1~~TRINITY_DN37291_c0_g1_i1.p1  ORF type:complete len:358 (+),score=25.89 TRINITY_DN37291_c0_g1_i1:7-1080(+)
MICYKLLFCMHVIFISYTFLHNVSCFFFQAEDGIRDAQESRGLGDVYKRQAAYFGCKVSVLPTPIPLHAVAENTRAGDDGQLQLDCGVIREYLCRELRPPRDSFCVLGITMQDMYIVKGGEAWNFVFGQASLTDGVGVFSFARYDPSGQFNTDSDGGFRSDHGLPAMSDAEHQLVLRRCCRVLTHEGTHVIGLRHCVHFKCLMNGSNHLQESDAAPLHLCPLCLRKLQNGCKFEVEARYRLLLEWYERHHFPEDAAWVQQQLGYLCTPCAVSDGQDEDPGARAEASLDAELQNRRHAPTVRTSSANRRASVPGVGSTSETCPMRRCQGKKGCICPPRETEERAQRRSSLASTCNSTK